MTGAVKMKDYQIYYFAICDLAPIYQNATCEVLHVFQFMVITLTLLLVPSGQMYVQCTYKPVHMDLVRITFGMKVFWTYGSVRTMYVHSRTYNVRTLYVQSNTKTELK